MLKKGIGYTALFALILGVWFFWADRGHQGEPNQTLALYLTSHGEVTDSVVKLLGLTGIRIANDSLKPEKDWPDVRLTLKSRSLADVVPAIQGKVDPAVNWFGDPKKERWEKDPSKPQLSEAQANRINAICKNDLRQGQPVSVEIKEPKATLFLGAALMRVRTRLSYLNHLYDSKSLSASLPVYLLMGERKLDPTVGEIPGNLMNPNNGIVPFRTDWLGSQAPTTNEGQMIKLVFDQSRHSDLSNTNIHDVYSSKGTGIRSTTETNVQQWLKDFSPKSGNYIAISNQPYVFYQETSIRRALLKSGRPDIVVQVVGPAMDDKYNTDAESIHQAKNLLNNLSRILYELLEIQKLRGT